MEKMIELGRPSRLKGAGFYEYVDGKRTSCGRSACARRSSRARPRSHCRTIDRMLFAEALRPVKRLDEGAF